MPGASIDSRAMPNTVDTASAARPAAGLDLLGWPAFEGLPVEAFVTGRGGGVSVGAYESLNMSFSVGDDPEAVLENRRRVAGALGAELADLVFCNQTHSDHPYVVSAVDRGRGTHNTDDAIPATDAVVTTEPGVVLVILAADCVPVVLYDPVAHVLGCVHSGWRGTVARVSAAALAAMRALGASPENVIAGLGPAISPERYQVGADVIDAVQRGLGAAAADVICPDGTGRWLLDLWGANRVVLREAGVADGNVHVTPYVTGDGRFFSDRAVRPCGRLALVARLRRRGE
jgi:purine-nucleoside/S-methyl-5'-thioadenosine phosphorylase / adenosine deaminase